MARQRRASANRDPHPYKHPEADSPMRPDVGTQAQFRKRKPPATYRYDSSLSPALDWDGGNIAREAGEAFIRQIVDAENLEEAKTAAERLKALSRPFLNWTGKAERLSFDCPTLPLFVHERLSTYIQATPDLMMGDLLKNMRSSQIFSVCGMPEVRLTRNKAAEKGGADSYAAELLGLDVFDPVTMEVDHRRGDDVPAWLLDTDYNDLCFHVCQAFFPRTGAWENIKRALKGTYEETVWDHLAGTKSAPFPAGEYGKIAVKVIDDRGNELLVVKDLKEAEG